MISIIIPVLNEKDRVNQFIADIYALAGIDRCEVIVVDGDIDGSTVTAIEDERVIFVTSDRGRGKQMNAGARTAKGSTLLFLHSDTLLPARAIGAIEKHVTDQRNIAGAFELSIDSDRVIYKWIAFWAHVRYKYFGLPYGDQGIFIRKDYFESIGGFADFKIMEDVDLVRRIKKQGGKICILPEKATTSARRWEKEGAVYGTLRNAALLMLFYAGVKPELLAKFYK